MTREDCYKQLRGRRLSRQLVRAYKIVLRALDYPEIGKVSDQYLAIYFTYAGRECKAWPNADGTQVVAHPILHLLNERQECPIWIMVGPKRCTVKRMDVLGMMLQTSGKL